MTGYINTRSSAPNPLSRLTIASLKDLGYQVNYTFADEYGVEDLNLSVCPLCNNGRRRQVRSATRQLGVDQGLAQRRTLSESVRQQAIAYGLQCLVEQELEQPVGSIVEGNDLLGYIGDQWMAVLVEDPEEEGAVFSIIVVADTPDATV